MEYINDTFTHLIHTPYLYYAVLAVALLIGLYVIYSYRRANQGIIPFKTQGGTIEIAPGTLRGVMQHAANTVDGVERATCRHFMKGRSVGVKVAIHLRSNTRLKDVEASIKGCIRATLSEQFGMENIEPIHIRVTRMVGDPIATPKDVYLDETEDSSALVEHTGDDSSEDERPYADETRI